MEPVTPRRDPRYRSLDIWRGVACLAVIVYHAGFVVGAGEIDADGDGIGRWGRLAYLGAVRLMSLGVPIFFVISGYCIAASADASARRKESAWAFLRRRFRRIYPPYWAALAGFVMVAAGLDALGLSNLRDGSAHQLAIRAPGVLDVSQWVGNLTLTETWRPIAWGPPYREIYTRVAWSLCYEEQFYLVCFLALATAPGRLFGWLAALSAVVLPLRVAAWHGGWLGPIDGAFPVFWHEFAAGLAVYWRLNHARTWAGRRLVEVGLAVLVLVGAGWALRSTLGAGLFAMLLIALRERDEALAASKWLAPLAACGRRCYSLYLAHMPVCTVGTAIVTGGALGLFGFWTRALVVVPVLSLLAVGAGWGFYAGVERRFVTTSSGQRPHLETEPRVPRSSMRRRLVSRSRGVPPVWSR